MDVRLEKARAIVQTAKVRQQDGAWLVPSQHIRGTGYVVTPAPQGGYTCTCRDFEFRRQQCKHILAVGIVIAQTETITRQ